MIAHIEYLQPETIEVIPDEASSSGLTHTCCPPQ